MYYLQLMIHPNPEMRPSAISLIQHRVLCPLGNKTKAQLRRELNAEKVKNEILSKQLQQAAKCLKTLAPNVTAMSNTTNAGGGYKLRPTPTRTSSRIVGKKVNRSNSTTNFWKKKKKKKPFCVEPVVYRQTEKEPLLNWQNQKLYRIN